MPHYKHFNNVFASWLCLYSVPYHEATPMESKDTINMLCMGSEL